MWEPEPIQQVERRRIGCKKTNNLQQKCQVQSTQLENLQWFEAFRSKYGANDVKLHQNGEVQYATIEYHNWFGTNLSIFKKIIGNYPHKV